MNKIETEKTIVKEKPFLGLLNMLARSEKTIVREKPLIHVVFSEKASFKKKKNTKKDKKDERTILRS